MTTSLTKLFSQRAELNAKIDARILAELASSKSMGPKKTAKRGRPAKTATKISKKAIKKAVKAAVAHKRAKNALPLHAHITSVLTGTQLAVKDVVAAVLKNGFKTSNPKGLYSQVAVALGDETRFTKIQRGVYAAVASNKTVVVETPATETPVATTETPVVSEPVVETPAATTVAETPVV